MKFPTIIDTVKEAFIETCMVPKLLNKVRLKIAIRGTFHHSRRTNFVPA